MAANGGEPTGQRRHAPLLFLLAGFLILGLIYARLIPPFEGPDEAQHFAYVVWLAEGKGLPPRGPASWETPLQQESGQPPLYYALASILARLAGTGDPAAVYHENPYFTAPFPRAVFDNDNRALHYGNEEQPLRGGRLSFYLARGLSLVFGMILILSVYHTALRLFPAMPSIALGAACVVAFSPQVIYLSSVVSNDIPAAALSALSLWFFTCLIAGSQGPRAGLLAFTTGVALGVAGLMKVSPLLLLLPMSIGIVWLWLSGRRSGQQALILFGFTGLGVVLTAGWWFVVGWLRDGSAAGLTPHDGAPWAITDAGAQLPHMAERWREVGRSFIIALGWGTIRPPAWVYTIALLFAALALAGWLVILSRWRRGTDRPTAETVVTLGVLALSVVVLAVFLELWMRRVTATHGRLLFPAITGIAILLVLGWRAWHPRLAWLGYGSTVALAVATPFMLILPAYTPPPLINNLPAEIGWRFGEPDSAPFAELVSVSPAQKSIDAGETLAVRLCWSALAQPARDYAVLLQLVGPADRVLASRYTHPGQGLRPTTAWRPGESWCDWVHIRSPQAVDQTLAYRLQVGMIDDVTDQRLDATDATGAPLPHTFVDAIRVVAPLATSGSSMIASPGDALQLLDHNVVGDWQVGSDQPYSLTWGVAQPVGSDLQLFVHLRDSQTGEVIAQADGPPLNGWYPTSWWEQGEVIVDDRVFPLPSDIQPGEYELELGWYDLETGERLGQRISLGSVLVRP